MWLLLLGCMVAAVLSLVLRFRRSRGVERQQLKWLTYSGGLLLLWVLVTVLLFPNAAVPTPAWLDVALGLLFALVPISAGIAVLRYRLYDIDRLINRTLVYGLLTVLLAGVYAGAVLVLGQLFGGVTGDPPSWAVAGATLAVAALFQPARRRIQAVVDRRFNRRKYNTAKTIQAYSTAYAIRSTSTPSPPNCWRSLARPWSRSGSRCGFDPPHPAPRAHPAVRHGQLPGPTER